MKVFTVGYGGRDKEGLTALLLAHGVRTVVDIRLRPDRASMGIWVKAKDPDKGIEHWLREAGIAYRSWVALGNVFMDQPDWSERFQRLLELAGGLLTEGLEQVPGPICLLCAEKSVQDCHRRLVAEYLEAQGRAEIHHLV